jgi:hypothetical protein
MRVTCALTTAITSLVRAITAGGGATGSHAARARTAGTVVAGALAVGALAAGTAQAAEWSNSDRLQDRRQVTAGTRAYSVGFQDGRFYANGWHITGEMGGIWAPPLKLADGVWFGVDDEWVQPATRFTSGSGYVRYTFPAAKGLRLTRTDFAPDGRRAVLFGLHLTNNGASASTVTVKVDVHSELLNAYPWSSSEGGVGNVQDSAAFAAGQLVFSDGDAVALAASNRTPEGGEAGQGGYRGPQPGSVCASDAKVAPAACDDGPHGNGAGGQLRYRVTVGPRKTETVWVAVAGSEDGLEAARSELTAALKNPDAQLKAKQRARNRLAARSKVDLPGDRALQKAIEWGKQNLADLTQTAERMRIRYVDQGKRFPASPLTTLKRATFIGAGYPDYPWLFATDGEYTAYAAVALGQFEAIKEHLLALRYVSDAVNNRSGKVVHETVTDGSVFFGANSDPGNTDETVKFPSAVALVWRWTGDNRFRDRLYDFSKRNLRYVTNELDADKDGWPEGLGNVEREGMGDEKLDNAVYLIRGLNDLADMARSKRDTATERWARNLARTLRTRFHRAWWDQESLQYADSLGPNGRLQQRHWIGVTPMETGLAPSDFAHAALDERESDCFSGTAPLNLGLFHTGCAGGPKGEGERAIYSLGNAIAAVAEGVYGRDQQQRYTRANAVGFTDEQPGALPETLPSEDAPRNIDRCWTCRSMVMQAWGHYGTAWPVIHQQLGVRPSLGTRRLEVIPRIPKGQKRLSGRAIRLGKGSADVAATRTTTTVRLRGGTGVRELRIGVTLEHGEDAPSRVRLNGRRVKPTVRETARGVEVTVRAGTRGRQVFSLR